MASNGEVGRTGRETRLLLLVIAVSVAVLLLLARWRFPTASLSVVTPSAAPLAELTARSTFDEMSRAMTDVMTRVSSALVVVPLDSPADEAGKKPQAARPAAPHEAGVGHFAIGLRVRPDLALVHLHEEPRAAAGRTASPSVVAVDPARDVSLVRVAANADAPDVFSTAVRAFPGMAYVAVIDPTPTGPTIQPVFIGRAEAALDARWSHPLIPIGPVPPLTVGSFVFAVDGRLIGMVLRFNDVPVIVPAQALETVVAALAPPRTPE